MDDQRTVKLTVINDIICTNCCVGQHELLSAISYCQNVLHLNLKFDIEFLPFRLISPKCVSDEAPPISKSDFYEAKLGPEKFALVNAAIAKWGSEKGVPISFKGNVCQSTRAHRLSRKAYHMGGQKLQVPILCALCRAHLEEGLNISDYNVLADIAAEVGMMTKDEALAFLESDELVEEVEKLCEDAKGKGIPGVPFTVIDGRWAVSGGQSSEVFVQIFKKLNDAGQHVPYNAASPSQHMVQPIA